MLQSDRENVERNAAGSKVALHEVTDGNAGHLLAPVLRGEQVQCRFTMCNPPFYQVEVQTFSISLFDSLK